jgi:hypothetical protein
MDTMTSDPDFLYDRLALEHFLTVLRRLRNDTQSFVENGPEVIELVGGYILFIDPGDCVSGFMASVQFAPPDRDGFDVTIAERRFEGGKADLFQFVVNALCEDVPNLKERLPCLGG